MAKFEAKDNAVFQLPIEKPNGNVSMGFIVCTCDEPENAEEIARVLNRDGALKDLATWLLKQKTLHLNKERRELLEGIINA